MFNISLTFMCVVLLFSVKQSHGDSITLSDTSLQLVQMMFRHGVRSILQTYPGDSLPASYWDKYGGFGKLVPLGNQQLYEFGAFFRSYYKFFLNEVYDSSRVYVRSTDFDRTLSSAYSFVAGLFRPSADQIWSPKVTPATSIGANWLPIPVHTSSVDTDNILYANMPCAKYENLKQAAHKSKEFLTIQDQNKEFLKNMTNLSGIDIDWYNIWKIADNTMIQQAMGLNVPQWVQDNYKKIMDANDYTFYIDFIVPEMAQLMSGGLLNAMRNNINNKVNASLNSSMQLYLYALHDNYIAGMLKLLNLTQVFVQPQFASAIVFELRADTATKSNYYVRVLSKNNVYPLEPDQFQEARIYGCDVLCPLPKFLEITKNLVITNPVEACAMPTTKTNSGANIQSNFSALVFVVLIGLFVFIYY